MQQLRKDRSKERLPLTLEDWTEHETSFPFIVSAFIKTAPNFGRRFAFGFQKLEAATKAFDALVIGDKTPKDFIYCVTDQSLVPFLRAM
jgi:hypothetical protein